MVNKAQGSVLILVLVFSAMIAFMVKVGFDSGLLQQKMVSNFKSNLEILSQLEKELVKLEHQLENNFDIINSAHISFLQFVPDSLLYNDKSGVDFYKVNVTHQEHHLGSVVGVRRKPEILESLNSAKLPSGEMATITLDGSHLLFHNINSGVLIKKISLNAKFCSETEIAIVDSKSLGYADFIYLGDTAGRLWKIDLLKEMISSEPLYSGKIISKPLIGRHPHGKGVIVYVLTENKIVGLWDQGHYFHAPFLVIEDAAYFGAPKLWQGYLLVLAMEEGKSGSMRVYDALSGKFIRQEKLLLQEKGSLGDKAEIFVQVAKPSEKERKVLARTKQGTAFCNIEIDYSRLGRRTWEVS